MKRRFSGHPAKNDRNVKKLFTVLETTYNMLAEMNGLIDDEQLLHMHAAAVGVENVYTRVTGISNPLISRRSYGEEVARDTFFKNMRDLNELVRVFEPKIDEQAVFTLKCSLLGLMHVYASLTGKDAPTMVAREVYQAILVRELANS